jgi:helix-turn-helix protein
VAMLPKMLEEDRRRAGWSMGQVAWRRGVGVRGYRELETGTRPPNWETWDQICKLYGWPQTFA